MTYRRKRKSKWAKKRSTAAQPRSPIADSQVVKMRYVDLVSINPGAGGVAGNYVFRCNDGYDPNLTGAGHQPMGWDQWSNFYDHCTVIGSKIRATFSPGTVSQLIASIHVDDNTTVESVPTTLLESTGTVWKWIGNSGAGGNRDNTLTKKFSTKKFFNVTDVKDSNDLKGTFFASPADDAYYHIGVFDPAGGDIGSIDVVVEIEYICLLSERRTLAAS